MPAILKPLEWFETEDDYVVARSPLGLFLVSPDQKSGLVRLHFSGQGSDDDGIWYKNVDTAKQAASEEYTRRALLPWLTII